MHRDLADLAFLHFALEHDLVARGNVGDVMERFLVILAPRVGVVGVILIVEGHAWTDDVQHRNAFVCECGFEQFLDLFWVAGKGARHKSGVRDDGFHADVNGHVWIGALFL